MSDEKWYKDFDESTHKGIETFENAEALAKSYIETKSMVGNSIRIPGEDAGDEDTKKFHESLIAKAPGLMIKPNYDDKDQSDAFYKTFGRPDDADSYKYEDKSNVGKDRLSVYKEIAFSSGMSQKQFDKSMEKVIEHDTKNKEASEAKLHEETAKLKAEWGSAYDEKLKNALQMSSQFFGDVFDKDNMPPALSIGLEKVFNQIGKEDVNASETKADGKLTPNEAKIAISEIYNNKDHPYFNPADVAHQHAMDKMVELQAMAIE